MEEKIGAWDIICKFVVGVGIFSGAWVSISVISNQLKPDMARKFWFIKHWPWLVPSVGNSLVRMFNVLGRAEKHLRSAKNDIVVKDIRYNLNRAMWSIWIEAMSCIALHSRKDEERCLALRNLSQVDNDKSMEHIVSVIKGVLNDPGASENVTNVARAALEELKVRQRMKN